MLPYAITLQSAIFADAFLYGNLNGVTEKVHRCSYDRYGDFMKLSPTGAGNQTARGARLPYSGRKRLNLIYCTFCHLNLYYSIIFKINDRN